MLGAIRNLVVLAVIAWGAWSLWHWQFSGEAGSDASAYARQSCVDEARLRYDTTSVQAHSVRENANGFTVRATMTLGRGGTARLTCLTNHNGRVTDVFVDER